MTTHKSTYFLLGLQTIIPCKLLVALFSSPETVMEIVFAKKNVTQLKLNSTISRLPDGMVVSNRLPDGKAVSNRLPDGKALSNRLPDGKAVSNRLPDVKAVSNRLPDVKAVSNR